MLFSGKNILFNILFLIGTVWCYHVYFQQDHSRAIAELHKDNNSSSNYIDVDTEIQDVEQLIYSFEFLSFSEQIGAISHNHIVSRLAEPHFRVWQPPKLS